MPEERTASDVYFQVLGPLAVSRGGGPVELPRSQLLRGVLAVLLLAGSESLPENRLAAAVWHGHHGEVSKGSVQVAISRLRAWLQRTAGGGEPVVVEHTGDGYQLVVPPDAVDLSRLRGLAQTAAGTDDLARRFDLLGSAMGLRRGPVLADLTTVDPADPLLQAAGQDVRAAALAFGAAALAIGRPDEALAHLQAEVDAAPFDEPVHACLIDLLAAAERPAEALLRYERLRRRLADELGVAPSEEVQRAYLAVLAQDRQLDASAEPDPAAGAPETVPAQLPLAPADFIGRIHELAELDALLAGDEHDTAVVIAAVSGTAGVGKTALAVHWAHLARDRFPDGQLYINLRGYDPDQPVQPADALAQFLTSLGIPGQEVPLDLDERAARFRTATAGRRMLIVLDNASSVEQVRPLLPGNPSCAVVVTSRDSLGGLVAIHGARRVDLDLLPTADAITLLRQLIGPRVDAEPDAAAALVEHCSRLPLALRLAAEFAAAHPGTPLGDLVADLDDQQQRLELLDPGGDPRAAVRTVFSWSIRHLTPDAARAFALLGVHPGPDADAYAVAALTDSTPMRARRTLEVLTRAHLVHATRQGRYTMHDLLRAYAASLARAANEATAALDRLVGYYLAAAAAASNALYPAEVHRRPRVPPPASSIPALADPDRAQDWLDTERPNLSAISAHAATHGRADHAVGLSATLSRYLASGHGIDALTIHSQAQRAARQAGDPSGQALALLGLGTALWQTGRLEAATEHFQQALALFRHVGERIGEGRALGNLGSVDWQLGRYESARDHHTQALALFREVGDRTGEAIVLTNLGEVDARLGDYERAAEHHSRSLELCREIGHRAGEAFALNNLGNVEHRLGQWEQAIQHQRQALALFLQFGDRGGAAWTLTSLGDVHVRVGRIDQASQDHREALVLFREVGERYGEARALNGLGETAHARDNPLDAIAHHTEALTIATAIGARDQQARAHIGLGHAHHTLADAARARRHYQAALDLYTDLGSPDADAARTYLATVDSPRDR